MFHESSQTVSLTLNRGIRRHQDAEWTSYCLRARDLVVEVQMQFLEICGNLVTSVRHNRFEGHFEFGMKTHVSEEWGDHGCRVRGIVVHELGQGQEVNPVILLIIDVHLKVLLQDLVDPFGLAVGLRVIGHQKVGLDA